MAYTPQEWMVVAAAREIRDGEVVFVGMRLPLLAFAVAKCRHAPRAVGLFENGVIRDTPPAELLYTMGDNPNIHQAVSCTSMLTVMGLLQRGEVDAGFIGGAEVDRFGNLNTSYIGPPERPRVKLPGSGGGVDIACLAKRLLIIMPHEKKRFVERVSFITSPGYGDGPGWRERHGLPRGGPDVIISTLGVFRFDPRTREAYLASYRPGVTPEEVCAHTGWALRVAPDCEPGPVPTEEELALVRRFDPDGFWTRPRA
ncbi:CoA-transferase subunit beta [Calditerricola satsumensis]|uniref:3-oxoadipate--succinyl-CoA transferase subunit B n=1 Tax=Calditerricola satsumensis TaxID=373054 RepID=A0A8J3B999_9BACI|nr:CoA-transferase [Calditerricola satsumensis]GGK03559.1 3-oxoadipate--succinyl-CoA transferase subunit B [Calditerricola satsumensis]